MKFVARKAPLPLFRSPIRFLGRSVSLLCAPLFFPSAANPLIPNLVQLKQLTEVKSKVLLSRKNKAEEEAQAFHLAGVSPSVGTACRGAESIFFMYFGI